jgi:mono/diheme cytochrome c family protein
VDLIRNSALIGRFAQLHSAACHASNPDPAAAGAALYGPGLTAGDDGQTWSATGDPELYKRIGEMELRMSTVVGVEVGGGGVREC